MAEFSLGDEVRNLIDDIERRNPRSSAEARVKAAWNSIIDDDVRRHVTGTFVVPDTDAGELIVYTDNPLWTSDLTMQTEMLRLELNMKLMEMDRKRGGSRGTSPSQAEQVHKIRFITSNEKYISLRRQESGLARLEREEQEMQQLQPAELDEEEIRSLREAVDTIEDEGLREAAFKAAVANLAFRKALREKEQQTSSE